MQQFHPRNLTHSTLDVPVPLYYLYNYLVLGLSTSNGYLTCRLLLLFPSLQVPSPFLSSSVIHYQHQHNGHPRCHPSLPAPRQPNNILLARSSGLAALRLLIFLVRARDSRRCYNRKWYHWCGNRVEFTRRGKWSPHAEKSGESRHARSETSM